MSLKQKNKSKSNVGDRFGFVVVSDERFSSLMVPGKFGCYTILWFVTAVEKSLLFLFAARVSFSCGCEIFLFAAVKFFSLILFLQPSFYSIRVDEKKEIICKR
ncbi:hypothetical protein MtrunA17_Chr1g0172211 [Medicago truncatula]|uniref:Transmembrane protein n=1 Tax=Medicago truncatula TaxID=3880 RepID=A0A396JRZ9_MEDTR|nr:hypothetical protein MtrunA17_Chr1g0172211 [Medicago truncatula]